MIDVKSLEDWIKHHTVSRSRMFRDGWVNAEDLIQFVEEHKKSISSESKGGSHDST